MRSRLISVFPLALVAVLLAVFLACPQLAHPQEQETRNGKQQMPVFRGTQKGIVSDFRSDLESGKEDTGKDVIRIDYATSTSGTNGLARQPEEQDGLLGDAFRFVIVMGLLLTGAGGLILVVYFLWSHQKKIRAIENELNSPKMQVAPQVPIKPDWQTRKDQHVLPEKEQSFLPDMLKRVKSVEEAMESIERRCNRLEDEVRKTSDGVSLTTFFIDFLKRQRADTDAFLQKIAEKEPSNPDFRFEKDGSFGKKITERAKKPFSEENVVRWWNEFGSRKLSKCKDAAAEWFSISIRIEPILLVPDGEEWTMIGICDSIHGDWYVLPRKNDIWWANYMDKKSRYELWFELDEKSADANLRVGSLKSPLPKARKSASGKWVLVSERKGRVSSRET